ncbi:indole-3-glycerol phosphate synthase TrpC [Synechococcales cyanobacterium C]|uniref:Indole-3-glycerol phosphate synthase n=1 Tax=Petrachloros mirabilis ULC683 TaxID=2781853 RepID=A0A8K2A7S0_9CYAN|nr:indole-3-glycerol phosphate synthase TrpC [Petrachloros mirabilis]NCJ07206.1 indole-3-glycerol phosphate synthase TrpC [Petrachloros mirabilis ULC683]
MQIRRRPPSSVVKVQELQYQTAVANAEPQNILEKIVWHKESEVTQMREQVPLLELQKRVKEMPAPLDFVGALRQGLTHPALIAEVKKASPSKGVLRPDFRPVDIALAYEAAKATCLSVLSDQHFFQGSFDYLAQIREVVKIPLLCKEFILYPYQIYKARTCGADAVLLIAAILSDQDLIYFLKILQGLGMAALIEVHTLAELDRVIALPGVQLVGINNRNLETFDVDLRVTCELMAQRAEVLKSRHIVTVSESGLHTASDLRRVADAGAEAVLVGESLIKTMTSPVSLEAEMTHMRSKVAKLFAS